MTTHTVLHNYIFDKFLLNNWQNQNLFLTSGKSYKMVNMHSKTLEKKQNNKTDTIKN